MFYRLCCFAFLFVFVFISNSFILLCLFHFMLNEVSFSSCVFLFFFLPSPVERNRKWRTKFLSYPTVKPRKISKERFRNTQYIYTRTNAYIQVRTRQTWPPFAICWTKFQSAPPTKIKILNDDIKLFKTIVWRFLPCRRFSFCWKLVFRPLSSIFFGTNILPYFWSVKCGFLTRWCTQLLEKGISYPYCIALH